jgi:hypothetical protein
VGGAGRARPAAAHLHHARSRDYQLAGRHGERYELVYSNRSQRHYEVVATVDGLDVLTGQAGSVHSAGYLLRPGETLRIEGFRKSQREVAAFRFAGKERAYAGNTPAGDARNVGVIGAALFEVRLQGRDAAQPAPERRGAAEPAAFPPTADMPRRRSTGAEGCGAAACGRSACQIRLLNWPSPSSS